MRAWVTRPASSSAVKTVFTASVASILHSRRTVRAAQFIATSSGLVAMQNASMGGPSHSADALRAGQRDVLRHHLADHRVQEDHDDQGQHERDRVHRVVGQADRLERALQQVGQRRLGDRAEAERADRDAELGAGDHQRDLVHRRQRPAGPLRRRGERLDRRTPGRDQRELAADEEPVAEQQQDRDQQLSHRPAPAARRRGPARSGAGRPPSR